MAVDCPDNFIARNKTPPRYPPPRPPQVIVVKSQKVVHDTTPIQTLTKKSLKHSLQHITSKQKSCQSSLSSPSSSRTHTLTKSHYHENPQIDSQLSTLSTQQHCTLKSTELIYHKDIENQLIVAYHSHEQQQQQHHHHTTTTTMFIINDTSFDNIHINDHHHQHQQQHSLNDTNEHLQQQNLYNQQQQLKLDQIENYENCLQSELSEQQQQHTTTTHNSNQQQPLTLSLLNKACSESPLKSSSLVANANKTMNGGSNNLIPTSQHPLNSDELELMVDELYCKNPSSHSSSFEEALSKKSSLESYDSISYKNLQNNNNNNNKTNSKSSNSCSSPNSSNCNSPIKQPSLEEPNSSSSSSSSNNVAELISGGMAPPEYELHAPKESIPLPPLIKHRELPVDVPDSFIEIVKTTPRYPPPAHLSSLSSQLSNSSTSTANTTMTHINSSPAATSMGQTSLTESKNSANLTASPSTISLHGSLDEFDAACINGGSSSSNGQIVGANIIPMGIQLPQPQVDIFKAMPYKEEVLLSTHIMPISLYTFSINVFVLCLLY